MIINDHERQPSFLRIAVEKLSNYFKKQCTYPERQGLPLWISALFILLGTLGNSRDNQVLSQPACLYFMMQLQKVIGHAY